MGEKIQTHLKPEKAHWWKWLALKRPWWKRAGAWLALVPIGTIVAIWGAIYTYKSVGADELRTKIYQPLYADLSENLENPKTWPELLRSGAIEQVPNSLRGRLSKVFGEYSKYSRTHSQLRISELNVSEIVVREMSSRIIKIRTEEGDRTWRLKASSALTEIHYSKKGISGMVAVGPLRHAARMPSLDTTDPNRMIIYPGGPIFVMGDWLDYPTSIKGIEEEWKDTDYLYFDLYSSYFKRDDAWYYRLTREDLNRTNTNLREFLNPVHEVLGKNPDFQFLLQYRPPFLPEIASIKLALQDRIRDPKQLRDLISH